MGFVLSKDGFNNVLRALSEDYLIYAPKTYELGGRFSDTDCVRYGEVKGADEIEFGVKSAYSYKEALTPVSQTLFFFTEDEVKVSECEKKGALIFLRSCDLAAVKRLDQMYLKNGEEDFYYKRLREKVKFVLMGCSQAFDSCFCVDMGSNASDEYHLSVNVTEQGYEMDCKCDEIRALLEANAEAAKDVKPHRVTSTTTHVKIPANLDSRIAQSQMWREYDGRCINCGRCNFVCPTCTCFTMQDIFYTDNGKVGERRRVMASCMVDGYTDVAGGGSYRQKNGERMRFKVLHKVLDFKRRNGYHMCVGCGRCDDICPEYISYSHCINKLEDGMKEVMENGEK